MDIKIKFLGKGWGFRKTGDGFLLNSERVAMREKVNSQIRPWQWCSQNEGVRTEMNLSGPFLEGLSEMCPTHSSTAGATGGCVIVHVCFYCITEGDTDVTS